MRKKITCHVEQFSFTWQGIPTMWRNIACRVGGKSYEANLIIHTIGDMNSESQFNNIGKSDKPPLPRSNMLMHGTKSVQGCPKVESQ